MKSAFKKLTSSKSFLIIVILAGVLATLIALAIGVQQSVWFDEAYSVRVAQQPLGDLLSLTAVDTHPPLYYMILKLWASIGGWGEVWLRLLSALFYGGSVIVGALLIRRLFNTKTALSTLPFLLLAPMLVRYGFEIRGYAMASFIGISATYAMVRARASKGWGWWAFYAVLVAAGMMTLYYMALLWLAHLVWLIASQKHSLKDLVRAPWLWAYIGSVVLFLPWMLTFLSQLGNGALAPISQAMTLDNLLGIITFNTLYQPTWQLDPVSSLAALFAIVAIISIIVAVGRNLQTRSEKRSFQLLCLYILVPIIILTIISLFRPMYVERYLSHVAIGGILLLGVACSFVWTRYPSMWSKLTVLSMLAVMSLGLVQVSSVGNYNFQRLQYPEIKQAASTLRPSIYRVIANDPYVMTELGYYQSAEDMRFFSKDIKLSGGYAPWSESDLRLDPDVSLTDERVQYVYYGDPTVDLEKQGYVRQSRQSFDSMTVDTFIRR